MKLSRSLVALIGVGFLGLASIGAGTGATFTDQTRTAQTIKAGTLNVVVEAPGSSPSSGKAITLPAIQSVGSTFDSPPVPVTIRNIGDITANPIYLGLDVPISGNDNDNALRAQTYVCITSPNPSPSIIFNGPLTTLAAMGGGLGQQIAGPLAPSATDSYSAEFYAGTITTACGLNTYGGTITAPPSLTSAAMGGTITPTVKVNYEG